MKKCSKCGTEKPLEDFNKDRNKSDGRQGYCRECNKAKTKAFRAENPAYHKDWHKTKYYENTYGITRAEYEAMVTAQGGKCLICGLIPNLLFVDHCHSSLKVRGLLCSGCNTGLGMFRDNAEALTKAIQYLEDRT